MRVAIVTRNRGAARRPDRQIVAAGGTRRSGQRQYDRASRRHPGRCRHRARLRIRRREPDRASRPGAGDARGASGLRNCARMGFAGYLVKPVRQASLIERLTPAAQDRSRSTACRHAPPRSPAPELRTPIGLCRRGLKILLAEDNPINALLTRELLRRRGHHVTRSRPRGNAAVARDGKRAASISCSPTSICPAWTASRPRARSALDETRTGRRAHTDRGA